MVNSNILKTTIRASKRFNFDVKYYFGPKPINLSTNSIENITMKNKLKFSN